MKPEKKEDFLVSVRRGPQDWQTAKVWFSNLIYLHWDCVTGGVERTTPYPMVMAYIYCDTLVSGEVAHSCSHGEGPHKIKICLIKKLNKEHWKTILAVVGDA